MADTVYDSDQQEQQEADSRPSVSPEQVRDLERSYALPAYGEEPANEPKNNDTGATDRWGDSDKKANSTKDSGASSSDQLGDSEQAAADNSPKTPGIREGGEAAKDAYDKLNRGYTSGSGKKTLASRMFHSSSATKKRIAIAGALAGGSVAVGTIAFFALLPFKITAIMTTIQNRFTSTATTALDNETEKLFSSYVGKYVLPGLVNGRCKSTVDATCVGGITGSDGPVKKLYQGWKQARIETKLADKYGIVIGKKGSQLFMNIDGQLMPNSNKALHDLLKSPANHSIFDVANSTGSGRASRQEVRAAVRDALKDATLYDRVFFRFKVMKLLQAKYGIKLCILACDLRDLGSNKLSDAKLAAKAFLYQRMLPEKWGLVMTCVISGSCGDPNSLPKASAGDTERLTPFQKDFQTKLAAYADKFTSKSLSDLVKTAQDISDTGLKKFIAREAVKALVGKVGGSDAAALAAGETAEKAMGPIGWIVFAVRLVHGAATLGPILQYASYAANVATAVETYESFNTVSSECKSGNCNMTELGSFSNALETNLSGNKSNSVSFTASPLYNAYFGSSTPTTASIFSSLLPGTAYADSTTTGITCDDGSPLPKGQLVCPEMHFDKDGNAVASAVSNALNTVPGLSAVSGWVTKIANAPMQLVGSLIEKIPGIGAVMGWAGDLVGGPLKWLMDQLIVTPTVDSGARQVDMIIAGAEKTGADATKAVGGVAASTVAVNAVQNEAVAEAKAAFDSQSLFARMFSTSSPYSFVSRLAMVMPTSLVTAAHSGLASLLTDPFSRLTNLISTVFSSQNAFADSSVPEQFGITQYVFPESDIPNDPEAYWDANCQGDFMTPWLNSQQLNPATGEADAYTPNPCLLIQATTQSAGAMFGVPQS